MKIAVVGSGISGLSSAYYLSKKHKVDLFEKEDRFGGHSHTLDIHYSDKEKVAVEFPGVVLARPGLQPVSALSDEGVRLVRQVGNLGDSAGHLDSG